MPIQAAAAFAEEPSALMRIHGHSHIPLRDVVRMLDAVDKIHRRYQRLDTVFILLEQGYRLAPDTRPGVDRLSEIFKRSDANLELPKFESATFNSPGFWEVLGSLSPLKFILDSLNFWHEHKKDRKFRDEAEAAKLFLNNQLLANEVIKQRLELLKSAGASDDEINRHFTQPMLSSISSLYRSTGQKAIQHEKTELEIVEDKNES